MVSLARIAEGTLLFAAIDSSGADVNALVLATPLIAKFRFPSDMAHRVSDVGLGDYCEAGLSHEEASKEI